MDSVASCSVVGCEEAPRNSVLECCLSYTGRGRFFFHNSAFAASQRTFVVVVRNRLSLPGVFSDLCRWGLLGANSVGLLAVVVIVVALQVVVCLLSVRSCGALVGRQSGVVGRGCGRVAGSPRGDGAHGWCGRGWGEVLLLIAVLFVVVFYCGGLAAGCSH
eukprot:9441761-Pyramimonas_sp.AAC.1